MEHERANGLTVVLWLAAILAALVVGLSLTAGEDPGCRVLNARHPTLRWSVPRSRRSAGSRP